jgi:hypothetical protein
MIPEGVALGVPAPKSPNSSNQTASVLYSRYQDQQERDRSREKSLIADRNLPHTALADS